MSSKRVCVYVDAHEWNEFLKNSKRENSSGSKEIDKFIRHYNETKRNPILKLDTFLDEKAESPMKVVCLHIGGATHEGMVYCRKEGWIQGVKCYSCSHNQLMRKRF